MGEDHRSILIVGAGPVGLTAALELARRGLNPRIVDDAAGPVPMNESRALGVNARTLTLLSPSGVTERILADALPLRQMQAKAGEKLLFTVDPSQLSGRFHAIQILPQGATERLLLAALEQRGIAPEWNTAVTAVSGSADAPQVTLRHPGGSLETVVPETLGAADGAHSLIRKTFGFGFPGRVVESRFYLADFQYEGPIDTSFGAVTLADPGLIVRLPVSPGVLRFISTLPDFESRITHPAKVAERRWASEFSIHFRHAEPMARGRVFLMGDAAHIHSPAGARGMNLGIEDACWFAYLVAMGREQDYSAIRAPAAREVLKQTYRLTSLVTVKNPVLTGLRNLLVPLILRRPLFTRQLLRIIAGYDTQPPPWIDGAE